MNYNEYSALMSTLEDAGRVLAFGPKNSAAVNAVNLLKDKFVKDLPEYNQAYEAIMVAGAYEQYEANIEGGKCPSDHYRLLAETLLWYLSSKGITIDTQQPLLEPSDNTKAWAFDQLGLTNERDLILAAHGVSSLTALADDDENCQIVLLDIDDQKIPF